MDTFARAPPLYFIYNVDDFIHCLVGLFEGCGVFPEMIQRGINPAFILTGE